MNHSKYYGAIDLFLKPWVPLRPRGCCVPLGQCWQRAAALPQETSLFWPNHYDDVIMTMLASQITSLAVVYSIVYSGVDQRKHQSSASLAFVRKMASYAENISIWWRHHDPSMRDGAPPHAWPKLDQCIVCVSINMALVSMDTFSTCLKSTAKKHHQIIVLPEYNHRKLLPR